MNKWQSLNLREQSMVLLGAATLLVLLLWFAVITPVQTSVAKQQQRNQSAEASLQRVRQLAVELKQLQAAENSATTRETNLTQLVDSSLRQNNIRMSGFQPGSDGSVSLRFDNVAFDRLLQWLYEIEVGQGVVLGELSVRQGGATGQVAATVRLRMASQ